MKVRTLSGRIAFLVGIATVLLLGGAAVLMDQLVDAEMQRRFDTDLLAQARSLATLVDMDSRAGAAGSVQAPARMLTGYAHGAYAVRCEDGRHFRSDPAPRHYPANWAAPSLSGPSFSDISGGDTVSRAVQLAFVDRNGIGCRLLLIQPREAMDSILLTIDIILLVIPFLALLLVLVLSPFLVRRGLQPLARLCASMRDVGPHHPGNRLAATGTRELEPVVDGFNDVLGHMDDVLARERRFTRALAHETRTRLAELHALVDVERQFPSGRSLDAVLEEVGAIGSDLEGTVSGLLLLTRLDAGLERMDCQRLDMETLVARHVDRVAVTCRQRALHVEVAPPVPPMQPLADASLLDIILGNLLGNACAYAPTGSIVQVRWNTQALWVDNAAPDLEPEEVALIGKRFWSKQQGRDGHMGLGLALAGTAAQAMGFELDFSLSAESRLAARLGWAASTPRPGRPASA